MGDARILIIDDDTGLRESLAISGHRTEGVSDVHGADAIRPKPFALGALLESVDRFTPRK